MQIEVLGERYQLQDTIGRGGMATIYRGLDMRMDRVVAIKVLREVYSTDPKFVTRFQREAKAASSLQHPNIVQVYDYGQTDGNYFIVMELVEGTDLRRYLRKRGVLDVDRAVIIAHDVALGLGAAHRRGIVHRDVKPQNVLVGRDGSIKLTDFGIASVYKDINAERLTTTGMTLGTVQYYAPEQAQGEIVSPAADVYALGIVMYEMLTGRTPFDGDTPVAVAMQHIQDAPVPPSQLNPAIPPPLEEIILRCLEKVPEMRFRDGSALARALELLGEEDSEPPTLVKRPSGESTIVQPPTANPARPRVSGPKPAVPSSPNQPLMPPTVSATPVNINAAPGSSVWGDKTVVSPGTMNGQKAGGSGASFDRGTGATVYGGQPHLNGGTADPYAPYRPAQAPTQSFQRNDLAAPTQPRNSIGAGDSRFASIVTALILLATLLLLGFSIFLAFQLGLINLGGRQGQATPTQSVSQLVTVPDLRGKSYAQAKALAARYGFRLQLVAGGSTKGVVTNQSPAPGYHADPKTSVIVIALAEPTPKVPTGLVGQQLSKVEAILSANHIPYVTAPYPDGAPNVVEKTDPPEGSPIAPGTNVTLYVNQAQPTPPPTRAPTPTPTTAPPPTPTTAPPTPTPAPPTPTPAPPAPTPTAGTGATPTPPGK